MFTSTSRFEITTTTYKNRSWIQQLVVWEEKKQVLINSCVFVFPNSFAYANSNLDFRENRTLYCCNTRAVTVTFSVKKITSYILVTKIKIRHDLCLGFCSVTIFWKMPYNSQAGWRTGFIEVSRISEHPTVLTRLKTAALTGSGCNYNMQYVLF